MKKHNFKKISYTILALSMAAGCAPVKNYPKGPSTPNGPAQALKAAPIVPVPLLAVDSLTFQANEGDLSPLLSSSDNYVQGGKIVSKEDLEGEEVYCHFMKPQAGIQLSSKTPVVFKDVQDSSIVDAKVSLQSTSPVLTLECENDVTDDGIQRIPTVNVEDVAAAFGSYAVVTATVATPSTAPSAAPNPTTPSTILSPASVKSPSSK